MRTVNFLAAVILTAGVLAAAPQKHPHFDDGGTLTWHTTLAEAKAAARKADKLILVEYGRAA